MNETVSQYDSIIKICKDIFTKKAKDYGTAWRILRASSITDQLFIKAQRIRTIEETGKQKIEEGIRSEYIGIVNYSIIGLMQLDLATDARMELPIDEVGLLFERFAGMAKKLMLDKNHDYGEAWRDMRVSSITDLVLMKILRIKQIEDNKGKTIISEGIDANYLDMVNYAVFALIRMEEQRVLN